jgi:hypothetical protein
MLNTRMEELIARVETLYKEAQGVPFPYQGCRKVLGKEKSPLDDLIPDLDLFFSDIAGYCSWGHRIVNWTPEEMRNAYTKMSRSFFEIHPKYNSIRSSISESEVPDLHQAMMRYDSMRKALLELLEDLSTSGSRFPK